MINNITKDSSVKMDTTLKSFNKDLNVINTGRANPAFFHKVFINYYGQPTPLQQLASFQNPEPLILLIIPFDKNILKDIEKAIVQSDFTGNPINNGNNIKIVMPELTHERRKEYVKLVKVKAENARVSIRNIRRKAKEEIDRMTKNGELSENEGIRLEKDLEILTKKNIQIINDTTKKKEIDLLEIS